LVTFFVMITSMMDPGIIPANHFDPSEQSAIHPRYCNILAKS
jgi:hypothetical protein